MCPTGLSPSSKEHKGESDDLLFPIDEVVASAATEMKIPGNLVLRLLFSLKPKEIDKMRLLAI